MDSSLQQLRSKAKIRDGTIASHVIRVKRRLLQTWVNDRPLLISRQITLQQARISAHSRTNQVGMGSSSDILSGALQIRNRICERGLKDSNEHGLGQDVKTGRSALSSSRSSTNSFKLLCKKLGNSLSSKPIRDLAI